jgi:type IV pilus assembly protein PilO
MDLSLPKINLRDAKVRAGLMIVALAMMGTVLWYQRVYVAKKGELSALREEKQRKEQELNRIVTMKQERKRLLSDIAVKRKALDSLKAMFPDEKEIPKLIREITRLARASGIYTTKFDPLQDKPREHYVENRYNLTLWGGYHEFAMFLSRLANLKLIINLNSVELSTHPKLSSQGALVTPEQETEYTVVARFEMTTFSSKK